MSCFMIAAFVVIIAFCLLGTFASGRIRSAGDYATANRQAGTLSVAGVLTGALVSGGSTVGTVQMAYEWGLSGWWFTLGSGIGCVILGLWFARPIRSTGLTTLSEFIERNYGRPTALLTLAGSVAGTLLSVTTQFMAGSALLRSVFPIPQQWSVVILGLMILFFIFTGGLKSFGVIGNAKVVVLYLMLVLCVFKATSLGQGANVLIRDLPFSPWLNLLGRGVGKDLGAGTSLILGILCTQIYIQAVFSAANERVARKGCLIAAFLIPPVGLMSVWIGLALRNSGVNIEAALGLPYFLSTHFPPVLSGAFWACLVITAVGGAAGLSLGVATNLSRDIRSRISFLPQDEKSALRFNRLAVLLTVAAAAWSTGAFHGGLILHFSYLGLSLRSGGMIVPLLVAIFRPGLLSPNGAFISSLAGFGGMLAAWILLPGTEPLFIGILASAAVLLPFVSKRTRPRKAFFEADEGLQGVRGDR